MGGDEMTPAATVDLLRAKCAARGCPLCIESPLTPAQKETAAAPPRVPLETETAPGGPSPRILSDSFGEPLGGFVSQEDRS